MTSVMAGVAKRYAVRTSCPVVMRELFLLPEEGRRLFGGFDRRVSPMVNFAASFDIEAASQTERETLSLEGSLPEGSTTVRMSYTNDWWGGSRDTDRNVRLDRLDLRSASGRVVASRELETVEPKGDCKGPAGDHFGLYCNRSRDVPIEVPTAGNYTIEVIAWADQAGDELPRLEVAVLDTAFSGAGAAAIRKKLVELHEKLLGVEVTPHSPDVDAAFNLFVEVMERGQGLDERHFPWWKCGFEDMYFFNGIRDDIVVERKDDDGRTFYDYDKERQDVFMDGIDFSDIPLFCPHLGGGSDVSPDGLPLSDVVGGGRTRDDARFSRLCWEWPLPLPAFGCRWCTPRTATAGSCSCSSRRTAAGT